MYRPSRSLFASILAAAMLFCAAAVPIATAAPATTFQRLQLGVAGRAAGSGALERTLGSPVDLVGASWLGPATTVEVRTARRDGVYGRWHKLEAERGEGPDRGSAEGRVVDHRHVATAPIWAPGTWQVQLRGTGVRDVELVLVASRPTSSERAAGAARTADARMTGRPPIHLRSDWGARPAVAPPWYADRLLATIVHHTDTGNGYACSSVPAILRAIQRYHMDANGWNDIGYNFLVDRCGGVWEGRGGGITRPLGGAHTAGFNTSTTGIALIGVHSYSPPSAAAQRALVRMISWRMDVAHRSPALRARLVAAENAEGFANGEVVVMRAVGGHRDLYPTDCPGSSAYRSINAWRVAAWRAGGPKVANVSLQRTLDPATRTIASGSLTAVANGATDRYRVTLLRTSTGEVLRTWRRAPGTLHLELPPMPEYGAASELSIQVVALRGDALVSRPWREQVADYGPDPGFTLTREPPASVSPNGDGVGDRVVVGFTLSSRRQLVADLVEPATGQVAATFESGVLDGTSTERIRSYALPGTVADGAYTLRIGVPFDLPGRSWEERALTIDRTP